MEDLKITACSNVLTNASLCSYVNEATAASNGLCCYDTTDLCDCAATGIYKPNLPYMGDAVETTYTGTHLRVNWDTDNHKYEFKWEDTVEEPEHVTAVYKASKKFKRITIK